MPAPRLINGLSEVADKYDAILCDVWGVVHNGRESWSRASEALTRFSETRGPVVLISNAPRPSAAVVPQLDELGVPRTAWAHFVTSGDATRIALAERAPGPAWMIGPERDRPLLEGLDLDLAGPDEAAFICCTGLVNDEVETPDDYAARLADPARRGLEMICANPDRIVQKGDRLIYCAGALADLYERLGGTVIMAGKPYRPIYDLALRHASGVDRSRVLAIGDALATDVKGASSQDLDCLFVAGGIHVTELTGENGDLDPARADALLAREGARAAYLTDELRW